METNINMHNFINRQALFILAIVLYLKTRPSPLNIDDMPTLRDMYDETITLISPICQPYGNRSIINLIRKRL